VIPALLCLSFIGCGYWLKQHAIAHVTTPVAAREPRATHVVGANGLENDADQWRAAHGAWTALDEYQLIRLLTDSAP
jgi:hypothetical protein